MTTPKLQFTILRNTLTGTAAVFLVDKTNVRRVNSGAAVLGINGDGRPDTLGLPLRGNSPDSWSLWVKCDFTAKPLAGLALSAGYHRRDGPIPLDASFARKFVVEDGYDRLDLMAGYATRIFQRPLKFQLNVDNVTDEFYADKSLGYANPRTWRFSATTTF